MSRLRRLRANIAARPLGVCAVLLFGFCLICDWLITRASNINSDMVQNYNELTSIWAGNFTLHDWALATNNYLLTDLPFYVLARLCLGEHPALIYIVPAAMLALQVLAYVLIVRHAAKTPAARDMATLAVLILLGLPFARGQGELHQSGVHGATITLSLYGIWMIQLFLARRRGGWCALLFFGLAVLATVASDPQADGYFSAPIALVILLRIWLYQRIDWREIMLVATGLIAAGLGLLLIHELTTNGGFVSETNYALGFIATPAALVDNLHALLRSMQMCFTARASDISGLHLHRAIAGSRALCLLAVLILCARIAWRAPRGQQDAVPQILVAGAGCLCVLDAMAGMFGSMLHGDPDYPRFALRYVLPAAILLSLAAATELQHIRIKSRLARRLATAAGSLCAILTIAGAIQVAAAAARRPPATMAAPQLPLTIWLQSRGFHAGVGDYWTSQMITPLSSGRVQVEPVILPADEFNPHLPLIAYDWVSDMSAANAHRRPQFVVFQTISSFDITLANVITTYGKPREVDHVGAYTVAILTP